MRCLFIFILFPFHLFSQTESSEWVSFTKSFQDQIESLQLPVFNIYYADNIRSIQPLDSVMLQARVFDQLSIQLGEFNNDTFSKEDYIDFELMQYILELQKFRIDLEKKYHEHEEDSLSLQGIYHVFNGQNWYRYLLKYWVDLSVEPEQLFEFGKKEIKRVENEMAEIVAKSGMKKEDFLNYMKQEKFFVYSSKEVKAGFEQMRDKVKNNLEPYFPFLETIPEVNIKQSTRTGFIKVPAFYSRRDSTFYYNYNGEAYDTRQYGWIYLHEGMPGHHYQIMLSEQRDLSAIKDMFSFSGYREGWAAYIEEFGIELGAYADIFQEYSKWEWDIIRSVRIVLDIGINYHGWTDEMALEFWQKHIKNKDDIAEREINRMRNWPAQVITYKYGADQIMYWKKKFAAKDNFSEKEFHKLILENGDIPFLVLGKHLETFL